MSVADYEIDDPDYCDEHGGRLPCLACRADLVDLYSDAAIQDAKESFHQTHRLQKGTEEA